MRTTLLQGDCVERMRELAADSIDAIVCDPPYSIEFMGRTWDRHEDEDAAFGYYLAGLIDGEGHFRVQAQARGTYSCAFAMKMRADDRAILEQARRFLGVGSISDEPRRDGSAPQAKLVIQAKLDCLRVVEVLIRYPLRAKKLRDFLHWADAVVEWNEMKRGHRWSGRGDWSRLEALKASVESARVYRDPPWSGNGFQDWTREWAEEALRVLKPGGHLLAFGGTRTYHRLACGLEDAGFEIRDQLAYMFGTGFPKSLDVSKAIDRAAGAERTPLPYARSAICPYLARGEVCACDSSTSQSGATSHQLPSMPATAEAARWQGWGTALKPAYEPVVVARKPLAAGTVAANVLAYGVGGLNIDGCRIRTEPGASLGGGRVSSLTDGWDRPWKHDARAVTEARERGKVAVAKAETLGRWPANVVLGHSPDCVPVGTREVASDGHFPSARPGGVEVGTVGHAGQDGLEERHTRGETVEVWECVGDCPVRLLDEQTGDVGAAAPVRGTEPSAPTNGIYGDFGRLPGTFYGDGGGASRFFYTAKTSRAERNAGVVLCSCETSRRWVNGDQLADTPPDPATRRTRDTTGSTTPSRADTDSPTTSSGRTRTDRSPTAARSTTETETSRTTTSRISSSSPTSTTSESTRPTTVAPPMDHGSDAAPSAASGSSPTPGTSTSRKRDGSPPDAADPATSERSSSPSSGDAGLWCPDCGGLRGGHPTVKPIELMRWLLRLVVPPGGTILDPFLGSGSTGCAAALEGLDFVGVELDPDYLRIAEARIAFWQEHGEDGLRVVADRAAGERVRAERAATGQLDLLGETA